MGCIRAVGAVGGGCRAWGGLGKRGRIMGEFVIERYKGSCCGCGIDTVAEQTQSVHVAGTS
jgi:hypothetical protein